MTRKRFIQMGGVGFSLALALCMALPTQTLAFDPSGYFSISYSTTFSQATLAPGESMTATITGTARCTADLPLSISQATITGRVLAQGANTGPVVVNPGYTVTMGSFPHKKGESVSASETVTLTFPASLAPDQYTITGEVISARVRDVLWFDVTAYAPSNPTLGVVDLLYPQPPPPPDTTAPPATTAAPPATTMPPETTTPPVTTAPPDTTMPPANTTPIVTTAPPVTIAPPDTTVPPANTELPATSAPPTTAATPVDTQPFITNVSVVRVKGTEESISWTTLELSDSQTEYWSDAHQFTALDTRLVTEHYIHITGLVPGVAYNFRVMSRDKDGNLYTLTIPASGRSGFKWWVAGSLSAAALMAILAIIGIILKRRLGKPIILELPPEDES